MISFKRVSFWLAAIALIPVSASAAPLTWSFNGTLSSGTWHGPGQSDFPPSLVPGAAFTLSMTWDPANFTRRTAGGLGYYRADNPTLFTGIDISFNLDCDSDPGLQPCDAHPSSSPGPGSISYLRAYDNLLGTSDVLEFYLFPANDVGDPFLMWRVAFGGPSSIFSFDGNGSIVGGLGSFGAVSPFSSGLLDICPIVTPADLTLRHQSPVCDAGPDGFRVTTVVPARVPEPATLALLGAGIAGIGFVRRRRRTA